jgi:hypothetical protein
VPSGVDRTRRSETVRTWLVTMTPVARLTGFARSNLDVTGVT